MNVPKYLRQRPTYGSYIVPYFTSWFLNGQQVNEWEPGAKPDFRVVDVRRAIICRKRNICWVCGKELGSHKWFVFGPASALMRVSVEPPSHRDCARYAVQTCPYMLNPSHQMRDCGSLRPGEFVIESAESNPGITVLWATHRWEPIPVDPSRGIMHLEPGEPNVIEFWRMGRKATRREVVEAIERTLVANKVKVTPEIGFRIDHLLRFAPEDEHVPA